jgi:sarcosine oxidase, subunit alpha
MSGGMTGPSAGDGQPLRRPAGGRVDRSRTLTFTFDGQAYSGHPGDTLASALLAGGVRTVARGIETGRPRGIYGVGVEEPNALVHLLSGACPESMLRATELELYDGLRAHGLRGKGVAPTEPDPARYDKAYLHCDVLVVGGGPAGLAAAYAAGTAGARVVLLDEQPELGGDLLGSRALLDGAPASEWVADIAGRVAQLPKVRVMARTTAVGYYDHNYVVAVERRTDHLGLAAPAHVSRQRLWHIRARRVVLATGAHERPVVFTDNDRPGIMLAAAARTYANRYGVLPGRRAAVFTTNDSAYTAALDLLDAGVDVAVVVDVRPWPAGTAADRLAARGVRVLRGWEVFGTDAGDGGELAGVLAADRRGASIEAFECDLLAVSGGWNPVVHLFSQAQGRLTFDDRLAAFAPGVRAQAGTPAGAARGEFGLSAGIADGLRAGVDAATACGLSPTSDHRVPRDGSPVEQSAEPYWVVPAREPDGERRQFVDLQRDVTVHDLARATGAGMRSVEHVKRYTTAGTANDQGKTSGVLTIGVLSAQLGQPPGQTGTTTFRPPYVPVVFGLLAGRDRGRLTDPVRVTPMHDWHVRQGAVFEAVGQWKRPWYYPRPGEDMAAAVGRECTAARTGVAVLDASTLGKIEIRGPDAAEFLDRIYTGTFSTLRVGSCRYGVMCKADGMVFDDGVTARLAPERFLMTTTTGNAAAVLDWLEEWLQTEWPDLRVHCTSVTDHWSTVAIVGPRSRDVVARLAPDLAVDNASFPFMTVREALVGGVPARVFRISFSGELAYEVNVPAWYGLALWEAVMAAGAPHGITPYGTETMHVLRAEKGYVIVGQETDGTTTPQDLGMSWAVSSKKADFVGKRSHSRPDTGRVDRKRLVGVLPEDPDEVLPEGAQLVAEPGEPPVAMLGHVTSSYRSAVLRRSFGLALVAGGLDRVGQRLYAPLADRTVAVTVTEPVFYDPEGARRDG